MSGSQTFVRLTREALEDHRQIHFYLDQITVTLGSLTDDLVDVEPLRRLAAQLEGLKERLLEHHGKEESGGLFQAILEVLPDCRVEISRLINQHDRMIEILEMARLHAAGGRAEDASELRDDLQGFLDTFRQHERDEDQLLRRALKSENHQLR